MHATGPRALNVPLFLAALLLILGFVLLAYMVTVESEPGALPLLLIALGAGLFVYARRRGRSTGA